VRLVARNNAEKEGDGAHLLVEICELGGKGGWLQRVAMVTANPIYNPIGYL
jgi:hypothetical protein